MKTLIIICAVELMSGCSDHYLRKMSAGQVGCTPDQITTRNYENGGFDGSPHTFIATCNGVDYSCTLKQPQALINCAEMKAKKT